MPESNAPIILLGAHRSGTTWLGSLFSEQPELAYWVEPRHVWTWSNAYTPDDVLGAQHATERVRAHIRKTFDAFVRDAGADRLCEKTPSNLLRIPFIRSVYPDAKLVMIVRDGRSVLRSTDEIMSRGVPLKRIVQRAKETPLTEWPAYARSAIGALKRKVTGAKLEYWGPRPPGWKDWVGADHPDIILAKQWAGCTARALEDAARIEREGQEPVLMFRYEDMLADPLGTTTRLCAHCELADPSPIIQKATQTADLSRAHKWRSALDQQTLDLVRPHMEPTMRRLGYDWDALGPTPDAPHSGGPDGEDPNPQRAIA